MKGMKASLIVSTLTSLIETVGDLEVGVSVDVSTGDEDAFQRVLGDIIAIQNSGSEITMLAEGTFNEDD